MTMCGTVFYESDTGFRIYCIFCQLKCTCLSEFAFHIKNDHVGVINGDNIWETKSAIEPLQGEKFVCRDIGNETALLKQQVNNNVADKSKEKFVYEDITVEPSLGVLVGRKECNRIKSKRLKRNGIRQLRRSPRSLIKMPKAENRKESDLKNGVNEIVQLKQSRKSLKVLQREDNGKDNDTERGSNEIEQLKQPPKALIEMQKSNTENENNTDTDINKADPAAQRCVEMVPVGSRKQLHKEKIPLKVHTIKITCTECRQKFSNRKCHDDHCLQVHKGFKCIQCDKRFKAFNERTQHEHTHSEAKFKCNVDGCGKYFADKRYLMRHFDVHIVEKNFICNIENCGKAFKTNRRLSHHKLLHTQPKNLICDVCGYSCHRLATLRVHLRIHTGERPFVCEVCKKRFVSQSSLIEHMGSHAIIRTHICQICNATFTSQKALYHHRFLHSDTKQFKCKICDEAFKQAAGLAAHKRKHRIECSFPTGF